MFKHAWQFITVLILGIALITPARLTAAPLAQGESDIVATAIAAGDFSTLVTAVEAAGLVETLQGEGPFTVFAPTDEAFAALPEGTVETLLEDPMGDLKDILLYHVMAGQVKAVDVLNSIDGSVDMVSGQSATISVSENRVVIAGAGFVATDIQTSNGIIHVIDAVMLPPTDSEPTDSEDESAAEEDEGAAEEDASTSASAEPSSAPSSEAPAADDTAELDNIVETAAAAASFSTLVAAVEAAGLVETLQGDGPFTVFAPTDDAFAALPEGTVESLLAEPDGALTDILLYHVLSGKVMSADVSTLDNTAVPTVLGENVVVSVAEGVIKINDATVIAADVEASNGVIHVIDSVLIPAPAEAADSAPTTSGEDGCANFHTVVRGDTLSRIAAQYGVDLHELARANGIQNPNLIYRGQRICVSQ